MKTYARFLAMLLATLMIASAAFAASAATFSDVESGYEHSNAINVLSQLGIINGYEDGTFKPDAEVERDEMAKLIFVLKTTFLDAGTGASVFTDTEGSWANGYISYCYTEGIIGGYGDGRFGPDDNITYDQALKMVCVALGYKDFSSAKWPTDVRLVGIKQLGLNAGLPSDLNGSDELTRGQVAQILYNALFATMNETKTVDQEVTIGESTFKVPVEEPMSLANDVWGFIEIEAEITATSEIALGTISPAKENEVKLRYITPKETDENAEKINEIIRGLDTTYVLADLGLDEFENKSYELIGRNIGFFFLDEELVEGTVSLKGTFDYNVEVATVKASSGADDDSKISIAGKKYDVEDVWVELVDGKIVKGAESTEKKVDPAKNFPRDDENTFINNTPVYEVFLKFASQYYSHKEYMTIGIDGDGDGEYDYLIVEASNLFKVTKIDKKKVSGEITYTYNFESLLKNTENKTVTETVVDTNLVSDIELAEDDVVIATMFGDNFFVKETVSGTEDYFVRGSTSTKYFNSAPSTPMYANTDGASPFYGFKDSASYIPETVGEDTLGTYYVVGKYIAYYDGDASSSETIGTAVIFSAEGATDWTYDETAGKYVKYYPMTLIIDGERVTVNVQAINGNAPSEEADNAYASYMIVPDEDGYAVYNYTFAAYELDEETGLYNIYTDADATTFIDNAIAGDDTQEIVAKDAELGYTESTGFYKLGDTIFEMDDASVIYYVDEDGDLAFYTAATMPKEFEKGVKTVSLAYFTNADEYVKTLVVAMIEKGGLESTSTSGASDPANHLFFLGDGNGITLGEDGYSHYVYTYIDLVKGELVETYSVLPAAGNKNYSGKTGLPMYNGMIGAYKADGQTLDVVVDKDGTIKNDSVVSDTITGFYEKANLIFLEGEDEGIAVANAKFIEITSEVVDGGETEWTGFDADKTLADLIAVFEDRDDNEKITIVYGWDAEDEEVDYVIFFDGAYTTSTEA